MTFVKRAALTGALVAAGAALAAQAPIADAQAPAPQPRAQAQARVAPRAVQTVSGWSEIGVSIREVDGADVKGASTGALVSEVVSGGPAEKAGVKTGDVFVDFDGERVRSARQFTRVIQETPAGRKVTATVVRDGQKVNLTIEPRPRSGFRLLGDLADARVFDRFGEDLRDMIPPPPPAPPAPPAAPATPRVPDVETFFWRGSSALGITTTELSSQLADYFGVKEGVLVSAVNADSAAAKAGIRAGDVITTFNGASVNTPSDLRRSVQRLDDGAEFTIGVMRDRKAVTLKGKMETRRDRWTFRS